MYPWITLKHTTVGNAVITLQLQMYPDERLQGTIKAYRVLVDNKIVATFMSGSEHAEHFYDFKIKQMKRDQMHEFNPDHFKFPRNSGIKRGELYTAKRPWYDKEGLIGLFYLATLIFGISMISMGFVAILINLFQ